MMFLCTEVCWLHCLWARCPASCIRRDDTDGCHV